MKSITLLMMGSMLALASCRKEQITLPSLANRFQKNVIFTLHQARDYSAPQYRGVQATVRLSVYSTKSLSGETRVLWDTTLATQSLQNFPAPQNPMVFSRSFFGIDDAKEVLAGGFAITYRDGQGQVSQRASNDFVGSGNSTVNIPVRL